MNERWELSLSTPVTIPGKTEGSLSFKLKEPPPEKGEE